MGGGTCKNCERWLTAHEMDSPCPDCGSMDRIKFAVDGAIVTKREAVARGLANKHFEIESGLTDVYWITSASEAESSPSEPIKLLEVNRDTIESGVMPLHFGPAPASGIPYPSIIIEVTPNEFEKIQSHQLKLPHGWEIWQQFPKPSNDNGDV